MPRISQVDEYPIPFDRDEIIELQEEEIDDEYRLLTEEDIIKSVDAFHDKFIHELTRTDEWSVFEDHWNHGQYIYFWNHQLGEGFKVDADWEVMCAFVDALDQFTDEYDAEHFEPAHYPWELP